jgi:protoheme IX farnesyltransferase
VLGEPGSQWEGSAEIQFAVLPNLYRALLYGYYGMEFAVASAPVNIWLVKEAVRFWKLQGHKGSARGLFWASVWHLPVVMILAMVEKKGMWQRVWRAAMGQPDLDEEEDWLEEDEEEAVLSSKHVKPETRAAAISLPSR